MGVAGREICVLHSLLAKAGSCAPIPSCRPTITVMYLYNEGQHCQPDPPRLRLSLQLAPEVCQPLHSHISMEMKSAAHCPPPTYAAPWRDHTLCRDTHRAVMNRKQSRCLSETQRLYLPGQRRLQPAKQEALQQEVTLMLCSLMRHQRQYCELFELLERAQGSVPLSSTTATCLICFTMGSPSTCRKSKACASGCCCLVAARGA